MKISSTKIRRIIREEVEIYLFERSPESTESEQSTYSNAVPYFLEDSGKVTSDVQFDWGTFDSDERYYTAEPHTLGLIQREGDPLTYEEEDEGYRIISAPESEVDKIGTILELSADVIQMVEKSANEFKNKYKPGTQLADNTARVIAEYLIAQCDDRYENSCLEQAGQKKEDVVNWVESLYARQWPKMEHLLDTIPVMITLTNFDKPEHPQDAFAQVISSSADDALITLYLEPVDERSFSHEFAGEFIEGNVEWESGDGITFNMAFDWHDEKLFKEKYISGRKDIVNHEMGHIWQAIIMRTIGVDIDIAQLAEFEKQGLVRDSEEWRDNTHDWHSEMLKMRDRIRKESGQDAVVDPFDEDFVHAICIFAQLIKPRTETETRWCNRWTSDSGAPPQCNSFHTIEEWAYLSNQPEDSEEQSFKWDVLINRYRQYEEENGIEITPETKQWIMKWLVAKNKDVPMDHRMLARVREKGCDDISSLVRSWNQMASREEIGRESGREVDIT